MLLIQLLVGGKARGRRLRERNVSELLRGVCSLRERAGLEVPRGFGVFIWGRYNKDLIVHVCFKCQ